MKYEKLKALLAEFVAEKKMKKNDAEELEKELEQVLDETIQKVSEIQQSKE